MGYYEVDEFTEACATCYYTCQACTDNATCSSCDALAFR